MIGSDQSGRLRRQLEKDTHKERVTDNPLWSAWRGLLRGATADVENGAYTLTVVGGTNVQVFDADRPRGSPE